MRSFVRAGRKKSRKEKPRAEARRESAAADAPPAKAPPAKTAESQRSARSRRRHSQPAPGKQQTGKAANSCGETGAASRTHAADTGETASAAGERLRQAAEHSQPAAKQQTAPVKSQPPEGAKRSEVTRDHRRNCKPHNRAVRHITLRKFLRRRKASPDDSRTTTAEFQRQISARISAAAMRSDSKRSSRSARIFAFSVRRIPGLECTTRGRMGGMTPTTFLRGLVRWELLFV